MKLFFYYLIFLMILPSHYAYCVKGKDFYSELKQNRRVSTKNESFFNSLLTTGRLKNVSDVKKTHENVYPFDFTSHLIFQSDQGSYQTSGYIKQPKTFSGQAATILMCLMLSNICPTVQGLEGKDNSGDITINCQQNLENYWEKLMLCNNNISQANFKLLECSNKLRDADSTCSSKLQERRYQVGQQHQTISTQVESWDISDQSMLCKQVKNREGNTICEQENEIRQDLESELSIKKSESINCQHNVSQLNQQIQQQEQLQRQLQAQLQEQKQEQTMSLAWSIPFGFFIGLLGGCCCPKDKIGKMVKQCFRCSPNTENAQESEHQTRAIRAPEEVRLTIPSTRDTEV